MASSSAVQPLIGGSNPNQPFRFMDLPSEARKRVYRILLCEFGPNPMSRNVGMMPGSAQPIARIGSNIHPSILRVCKSVYREAFDVLVSTNRLVRIKAAPGVPLMDLISRESIPVIELDPERVDRFRGCSLALAMCQQTRAPHNDTAQSEYGPRDPGASSLLILGRDMERFCRGFAISNMAPPGSTNLLMYVTLAPLFVEYPFWEGEDLKEWFSRSNTQRYLLRPLMGNLRGIENLRVRGHVSRNIRDEAEVAMAQERTWQEVVLFRVHVANKRGNSFFEKGDFQGACRVWRDAVGNIDSIRRATIWATILQQGNMALTIARVYFEMLMNITATELLRCTNGDLPLSAMAFAKRALDRARKSMEDGFWGQGITWTAEPHHKATLWCKIAEQLRLEGEELDQAMDLLQNALVLVPGDTEIMKQQQALRSLQETSVL